MSKTSEFLIFLSRAVITGLAVAFLVIYFWPSLAARLQQPAPEPQAPPAAAPASYADAVNRAGHLTVKMFFRGSLRCAVDR